MIEKLFIRILTVVVFLSLANGVYALDADDQDSADDSKQDT